MIANFSEDGVKEEVSMEMHMNANVQQERKRKNPTGQNFAPKRVRIDTNANIHIQPPPGSYYNDSDPQSEVNSQYLLSDPNVGHQGHVYSYDQLTEGAVPQQYPTGQGNAFPDYQEANMGFPAQDPNGHYQNGNYEVICSVCSSGQLNSTLLICAQCSIATHFQCLNGALPAIPNVWYCNNCRDMNPNRPPPRYPISRDYPKGGPEEPHYYAPPGMNGGPLQDHPVENLQNFPEAPYEAAEGERRYYIRRRRSSDASILRNPPPQTSVNPPTTEDSVPKSKSSFICPLTRLPYLDPIPSIKIKWPLYDVPPSQTMKCISWSQFKIEFKNKERFLPGDIRTEDGKIIFGSNGFSLDPLRRSMFKPVVSAVLSTLGQREKKGDDKGELYGPGAPIRNPKEMAVRGPAEEANPAKEGTNVNGVDIALRRTGFRNEGSFADDRFVRERSRSKRMEDGVFVMRENSGQIYVAQESASNFSGEVYDNGERHTGYPMDGTIPPEAVPRDRMPRAPMKYTPMEIARMKKQKFREARLPRENQDPRMIYPGDMPPNEISKMEQVPHRNPHPGVHSSAPTRYVPNYYQNPEDMQKMHLPPQSHPPFQSQPLSSQLPHQTQAQAQNQAQAQAQPQSQSPNKYYEMGYWNQEQFQNHEEHLL